MSLFNDMNHEQESLPKRTPESQTKSRLTAKREGIISSFILNSNGKKVEIIVDVKGNGERIAYNEKLHENLGRGDIVSL